MRVYKCDSYKCHSEVLADELPDDWHICRDSRSDESVITCPKCMGEQDAEMERLYQEWRREQANRPAYNEPEERAIDWREAADYYRDLAKDGMI